MPAASGLLLDDLKRSLIERLLTLDRLRRDRRTCRQKCHRASTAGTTCRCHQSREGLIHRTDVTNDNAVIRVSIADHVTDVTRRHIPIAPHRTGQCIQKIRCRLILPDILENDVFVCAGLLTLESELSALDLRAKIDDHLTGDDEIIRTRVQNESFIAISAASSKLCFTLCTGSLLNHAFRFARLVNTM